MCYRSDNKPLDSNKLAAPKRLPSRMVGHLFDAKYEDEKLSTIIFSARTSCFILLQICSAKLLLFLIQILPKPHLNFKPVRHN